MSRSIFLGDLRNGTKASNPSVPVTPASPSKFSGHPTPTPTPTPTPSTSIRVVRADGEEAPEVIVAKAKPKGLKKKCCGG